LHTETGLFVTSTVRDITDRKRAEEQIKKLNAELAEALRRAERLGTTGELAATMAHEIDTSLDSLTRLLSKMETHVEANHEMKELISAVQEEVMRMTHITGRALAIQRQHDTWKTS
jgi:signal transduction histidine kinase